MACREHRRPVADLCCTLLLLASSVVAAQSNAPSNDQPNATRYAGRPLAEALELLRADGLDMLYSSQLVVPEMRVEHEPRAQTPEAVLGEILAPHGLQARRVGANRFLVVRAAGGEDSRAARSGPGEVDARTLDEVLVHASRYALGRGVTPSVTLLDRQRLDVIPGVEQDAIRSLQRIPGSASGGLSALSHVRGSYEDEVLIRFDGVRLYEPFHLKDFLNLFGAVDPELIDTVDVFSGGFPVEYGDRAAGVLDIAPRATQEAEHLIGTSVIYNRAISSGSHSAGRGQWLAGYRRSNLIPVLHQLERDVGEPLFEDILLRYSYHITPTVSATVGYLALEDDHELFTEDRTQQATARYSDDATWLWLNYEQDLWSLSLHAAHSQLSAKRSGTAVRAGVSTGSLRETRDSTIDDVRLEWSLRRWDRLHWRGGLDFSRSEADYDYVADATFLPPLADAFGRPVMLTQRVDRRFSGDSYAPWIEARGEAGRTTVELGLRFDERSWLERSGQWSPRASVRYDLDDKTVLRASAGRFLQSQTLNELEVEEADPQFAAPESSRQAILGLERLLPRDLKLRIEAFDRRAHGVRPRFENVLTNVVLLPEIEVDRLRIAPHTSHARGVEISVQGAALPDLSWWTTYTWSRSDDRFDGNDAPRSWDQRNSVLLGAAWRRPPWLLSAVVGYSSGWPFTELRFEGGPAGDATGFTTATLGPRNGGQFGDRLLVDLRARYSLSLRHGQLEFIAEVRNAASRGNDCCRDVEVTPLPAGAYSIEVDEKEWLGLLPIIGVNWRF